MSNLIAFGSSTIMGSAEFPGFPGIIAAHLGREYIDRSKPVNSNSKISRNILSYQNYSDDFILVSWTSTIRHEFRTEHGWMPTNMATFKPGCGFEEQWYNGPGKWEYTGVSTALKEIVLTQTFLKTKKLPYVFIFDTDDVICSFLVNSPDPYIATLLSLIDWKQFVFFENKGFIRWCTEKNYGINGNHMTPESHQLTADYIIENFELPTACDPTTG
jgi:hypothetical protein